MTQLAPVLGMLAGLLAVADTIPYIRDTLHGTTRPHRGTWLIWGLLAIVVSFSQRADGASWSLIMAVAQAVVTSLVFLLAIRRGDGGISPADLTLIAIAMAGVAGWIIADEPLVATVCVVAADLIGAGLMEPKTYRDPGSETLTTFAFASLGGALAAGSVGALARPGPAPVSDLLLRRERRDRRSHRLSATGLSQRLSAPARAGRRPQPPRRGRRFRSSSDILSRCLIHNSKSRRASISVSLRRS